MNKKINLQLINILDKILSVFILFVTLPIILFSIILIYITDGMPVIIRQERVGHNGKHFFLYKFRTMINDAEKDGPKLTVALDKRITPLGRIFRKFSIDELPQFFNVLKGDMSVVGPRPEREFFIDAENKFYIYRLKVKPGITGLAQINGRSDLPIDKKLIYDKIFVDNYSIKLYIYVLLKSIVVVLSTKGTR